MIGPVGQDIRLSINKAPRSPVVDTQRTAAFLHAHLDDEAFFTGGTMAMLAEQGHRTVSPDSVTGQGHQVVLLVATWGELSVSED